MSPKKRAVAGGPVQGGIRLQRYLAQSGVAARRKAEALIVAGEVKVNGVVVRELGVRVDPERDQISVGGEAVHPQDLFYVVLNKPKACITSVVDPEGRPTVMAYLPNLPVPIVPVGRLDYYSEGVLLLTNDGTLASALLAKRTHVEKTYHVKIRGQVSDRELVLLRQGVRLDDGSVTREAEIDRLAAESKHAWLVITLTEGKSRQIHRMFEAFGKTVTKLQRVAFAGITFHGLRVGDARELTQAEVSDLYRLVELERPARAAARGKWKALREDTDLVRGQKARADEEKVGARPAPPSSWPARPEREVRGRAGRPGPARDKRARSARDARSRPARGERARPARDARSRPARGAPSWPARDARSRPARGAPSWPARDARSRPARGAPSWPARDERARPARDDRSRPARDDRARPARDERSRPARDERARPTRDERTRPGARGAAPPRGQGPSAGGRPGGAPSGRGRPGGAPSGRGRPGGAPSGRGRPGGGRRRG